MQEALLAYPTASLDELLPHDRNLPRRATKRDEAELEPERERFHERRCCGFECFWFAHTAGFQLWVSSEASSAQR